MNDLMDYVRAKLAPKEARQFERAIASPKNQFHDRVIRPQFYRPDRNLYLGIAVNEHVSGRNHRLAQSLVDMPEAWEAVTYFTNPMSIPPEPESVFNAAKQRHEEKWVNPMDRIIWGDYQVMTFEFDKKEIEFFREQLSWFRSPTKKPSGSAMGRLFAACSQWVDFEGITVAWSGNKSFHIHIVFSTAHAQAIGLHDHIRPGIMATWRNLMPLVTTTLGVTVIPDMGMDQPEKFRRIPNGVRVLDKTNILGMPPGTEVRQLTLWEQYRDRSPKGALTSVFDPSVFKPSFTASSHTNKTLTALPYGDELDFCRDKMAELFNDMTPPIFHDFTDHQGGIRAHFRNHPADSFPASYMEIDYRTVNINGSNPLALTPSSSPKLPKPLGEMMVEWIAEYNSINARQRSAEEQRFAMAVKDQATARTEICNLLLKVLKNQQEPRAFICAPEGISKSTSLFNNHQRIDHWMNGDDRAGIMYAFADYESAREKAHDFNTRQAKFGFKGVVLESFERAYKRVCANLRVTPLTLEQAQQTGHRNLWHAIERLQPFVLTEFESEHTRLWQDIGTNTPVFFTVHAVAHNWCLSSPTRMMHAPSFWITQGDEDHTAICRTETRLNLLIHDEVKVSNLLAAYPIATIQWVDAMVRANAEVWSQSANATDRLADFLTYRAANPAAIDWTTVQDVFGFHGHEWDIITTHNSGEYGAIDQNSPYAPALDKQWGILERRWPVESARKTVILTTEAVPLAVARKSTIDWSIYDLDTPRIERDVVKVKADKGVTASNLAILCAGWQKADPDLFIVSNKVSHLPNTMTHARARGSNLLIGKNILQTMVFINPDEFEYLEALNAWTERGDLIRHRHVDEFNQTAGRNLGFRRVGDPSHHLLVNRMLFDFIVGEPKARVRYQMALLANTYQKKKAGRIKRNPGGEASRTKLATIRALHTLNQKEPTL